MEVDAHLKSILKKPKTLNQNKSRRKVSFSNTAKLFFSDKNVDKTSDIPNFKYVEISIVDKSSDKTANSILFEDCRAEDFLVHKVVYDNDLIEDENDHDINQYDVDHEEQTTNNEHNVDDSMIQINCKLEGSNEKKEYYDVTIEQICSIKQNDNISCEPVSLDTQNVDNEANFVTHEITEVEDEGLEFIVHKVVQNDEEAIDFEDSSIQNEANSNSNSDMRDTIQSNLSTNFIIDSKVKPVSELSIENILEHDKIIAYNDQNNLSNSSIVDAVSNVLMLDKLIDFGRTDDALQQSSEIRKKIAENVVLSPPLQELSLEKIVRAHSDNILCELDISPLNSVQETDSESDISSEDTMIMMTSEECQKNEQHIRQSFLEYQSLKGNKPSDGSDLTIKISLTDNKHKNTETKNNEIKMDDAKAEEKIVQKILLKEETRSDKANGEKSVVNNVKEHIVECPPFKIHHAAVSIPQPIPGFRKSLLLDKIFCPVDKYCDSSATNGYRNSFRTCDNSSNYWDKTLSKVEIPKDVREWKITPSSINRNADSCPLIENNKRYSSSASINNIYENETQFFLQTDDLPPISKPDELEHFVNESTERVERIRKRYNFSERSDLKFRSAEPSPSPLRGIRPRFGSTAEILQLMQKQNQSSFLHYDNTKSHMSWPFSDTSSMSTMKDHERINSSEHFYNNQRIAGEGRNTYHDELLHSNICDYSILSCPSFIPGEREAPEGASPPRSLIEHGSDEIHTDQNPSSDNVVYYSMKV